MSLPNSSLKEVKMTRNYENRSDEYRQGLKPLKGPGNGKLEKILIIDNDSQNKSEARDVFWPAAEFVDSYQEALYALEDCPEGVVYSSVIINKDIGAWHGQHGQRCASEKNDLILAIAAKTKLECEDAEVIVVDGLNNLRDKNPRYRSRNQNRLEKLTEPYTEEDYYRTLGREAMDSEIFEDRDIPPETYGMLCFIGSYSESRLEDYAEALSIDSSFYRLMNSNYKVSPSDLSDEVYQRGNDVFLQYMLSIMGCKMVSAESSSKRNKKRLPVIDFSLIAEQLRTPIFRKS